MPEILFEKSFSGDRSSFLGIVITIKLKYMNSKITPETDNEYLFKYFSNEILLSKKAIVIKITLSDAAQEIIRRGTPMFPLIAKKLKRELKKEDLLGKKITHGFMYIANELCETHNLVGYPENWSQKKWLQWIENYPILETQTVK